MPKAKLKVETADNASFAKAAEFNDVKVIESIKFGSKTLHEVSFKAHQQVLDLGRDMQAETGK